MKTNEAEVALKLLERVELRGNEVDAYMMARTALQRELTPKPKPLSNTEDKDSRKEQGNATQ